MVAGILRPIIVLPADAEAWDGSRRRIVLLHEFAHVCRHDLLTQLIASLAAAINWFNPIAWYGLAQMRKFRELACDDKVLASGQQAADYADVLLGIARSYRNRHSVAAICMARSADVENRILAILDRTRSRIAFSRRAAVAIAVAASAAALAVGVVRLQSRAEEPKASAVAKDSKTATKKSDKRAADVDAHTMKVRITDENDKPLPGASLHVSVWELDGERNYPNRNFKTDKQGYVAVELPRRLRILRMWPNKSGYVPEFVNFAEGTHDDGKTIPDAYHFRLARGTQLSGQVVDSAGKPIAGTTVAIRVEVDEPAWSTNPEPMISTWLTDKDFANGSPITDSDGRFVLKNAPAPPPQGKDFQFRIKLTHKDYRSDSRWGELQDAQHITTADLRAGKARLVLSSGTPVKGTVVDQKGKPVTSGLVIWSDDPYFAEGVNEAPIDAQGHYETLHLPDGKRSLTVLAPGFRPERREVTIAEDMPPVDFTLQPGKRLRIKIEDQQGKPIPKAYVNVGEWRGAKSIFNEKHPNVPESHVPRNADQQGIYLWDWAPEDAVNYEISAIGFAMKSVTLVANDSEHIVQLSPRLIAFGKLKDAVTGEPIKEFSATPVQVFRPKFLSTSFNRSRAGKDGSYEVELADRDYGYRYQLRIDAPGYRSALSEKSFANGDGRVQQDFSLQPSPPRKGKVFDPDGKPVAGASIVVASPSILPDMTNGKFDWRSSEVKSEADGRFQLNATFEPIRVRVVHDSGFAEILRQPDEQLGDIQLQPWAKLSGRLMNGGKPIAGERIFYTPGHDHPLGEPRFQGIYQQKTDAEGRFEFERVPPGIGSLRAQLGPWKDSQLTSSQAEALDLQPGEERTVALGGEGATVNGKVVSTGRDAAPLDKHWSLNYLVSREQGVALPVDFPKLSFDPTGPLELSWLNSPQFRDWRNSRRNYYVKLSPDGDFTISGVPPGKYDLVIQLYEQPTGCLVETVGEKVVPVQVTESEVAGGKDVGTIEVPCRVGPRPGENMQAFKFTDPTGREQTIADLKGRYVVMHAWASWCVPCVESLPDLQQTAAGYADKPVTFIGLNIDSDKALAEKVARDHQLNWSQNYLGESSDMAHQLALSSAPAYYLIGPEGLLIATSTDWKEIKEKLKAAMSKR